MKIFTSIKKKWLQHRVYKYTLKYDDSKSKSNYHFNLAHSYYEIALSNSSFRPLFEENIKNYHAETLKGEHYNNIASIYSDKKLDLEEELQFLKFPKAY